jgi:hypothetical protein
MFGGPLKTLGGGTGAADESLDSRTEAAVGQAVLLVEGKQAELATAAEVIGALIADRAGQSEDRTFAVAMKGSRLVALGAGYTGSCVAVFFSARACCWALAAMR